MSDDHASEGSDPRSAHPHGDPGLGGVPGVPQGGGVPAPRYGQYLPGQQPGDPRAGGGAPQGPAPHGYGPHGHGPSHPGQDNPGQHNPAWGGAPSHGRSRRGRGRSGWPVTWTLIGICAGMWALQWLTRLFTPYDLSTVLGYAPALTASQPWRMLTSGFVHAMPSPVHLLLNMYTLYLFGRMLEPLLGAWRMAALFLLSVLGGSVGVLLLGDPWVLVIGASGGIFGLFGAMFVFMRHFENNMVPITVLIVINLAFGFLVGGVAWQAHLGGLVTGAIVAALMLPQLRRRI